ncbi:MAG: von Willebrand factor type A domain-containing protein [Paludibacteraceae bacterium]|nr:von Willebrand factor type A domain-containing protein [Paludibacteraceae bacterium]
MKHIRHAAICCATMLSGIILTACMNSAAFPDAAEPATYANYDGIGADPEGNPETATGDRFEEFKDNPFVSTAEEPKSTFSVDADGTAYAYMRAVINNGYRLNKQSVRIEEYLNYFTFNYPDPTDGNPLAINAEMGDCPWNKEHRLLRLGLKGKSVSDNEMPASNYVFMIDVSGSMNGADRLDLLKKGMTELVDHLNDNDRVSIVTYSGEERLALESTLVKDKAQIKSVINSLKASGATAGAKALEMSYKEAEKNYIEGGNNRIIMGTDGDFNVGVSSTEGLLEIVSGYADKGIYMTVCGFGMGNFNDAMMEKISNAGNGTYIYVDSEDEMLKVFNYERSHLLAVCSDTKVQITFNPKKVSSYRLIGYENRVMSNEDFEDDTKDAGEIGAGQTITALYELVPADEWDNETSAGTFDVRYKNKLGDSSIAVSCPLEQWSGSGSENLNFAAGVAAFGMILRDSEYKGEATLEMASTLIADNRSFDPYGWRGQLLQLIDKYASENK